MSDRARPRARLFVAFWLSGLAAIFYQLIWQRVLLGIYGVEIEAATIVVAAFLLGLGVGSLAGGWLADRGPWSPLATAAALELAVAACGASSVPVFRAIGMSTIDVGPLGMWATIGAMLLVPTALMGATFPLLSAHAIRATHNVGGGLGGLYAANTLGSAAGALIAVLLVVAPLGQQGTAECAAILNLIVAAMLLAEHRRSKATA